MKGKSSINLTSLVEFEHHLMAETIRKQNEDKKNKSQGASNGEIGAIMEILILRHIALF